jgi:hypothetical protein
MGDNTTLQLDSPGRRAAAYWFVDGLPEIAFGLVYLVWGALGIVWGFHTANPWIKGAMLTACVLFLILFAKDRLLIGLLKARVTYPRTGYVRPPADPPPDHPGPFQTLLAPRRYDDNVTPFRTRAVFLFFTAMAVARLFEGRWSVPAVMIVVAVLEYFGNRNEVHPYTPWAVLPIGLAGVLSAFLDLPAKSREFIPLTIGGAWLLVQGLWTLVRYLRAHPSPRAMESVGL